MTHSKAQIRLQPLNMIATFGGVKWLDLGASLLLFLVLFWEF
ncbi:hypothetical protein [Neptunomonas sp. XY-337]|nr:hypothetical protein [Neptunomonas sp. XY-337]